MIKRIARSLNNRFGLDIALGILSKPEEIFFNLCWSCNFKCVTCDIGRRVAGSNLGEKFLRAGRQLDLAEWKKVIDSLGSLRPAIQFSGTEPTLHKDFLAIVKYLKARKFPVSITTNGWLLSGFLDELIKAGVENIGISVDGLEKTHDLMRGMPGSYERIIKALGLFRDLKKKYPASKTRLITNTTITEHNYKELAALYNVLNAAGVDVIGFSHLWFKTEQNCGFHNIMFPDLAAQPTNLGLDIRKIPFNELWQQIKELRDKKKVTFYPRLDHDRLKTYYESPEKKLVTKGCRMPWRQMEIMPDGEIILGGQCFSTASLGNALNGDILEVWKKDPSLQKLRDLLKRSKGYLPGCSRCCVLYKYS
jgi:MoaA/NifB/PqqE/SkfB family radical SAM enzyme